MKKAAIFILLISLPLILGTGTLRAVDIGGEFRLDSSYDTAEDEQVQIGNELELNFSTSSLTEAFNVTVALEQIWPEDDFKITLRDAYFDYYGNNFDLRAGRQTVSWGTAAGYNPTDIINPPDPENPLEKKNPLLMLKGDYFIDHNYTLTGILVPYHQPALEGEIKASEEMTIPIEEIEYDLSSLEYAVKFSARGVEGFDFSTSLYYGHEKLPRFNMTEAAEDNSENIFPESAYYQRLIALGADMATEYESVGLWAEGAYLLPEDEDSYGSLVLGADYHLETGQLLSGQFIYRNDRQNEDNFILQSVVEGTFGLYHEARMAAFYNISTGGYLIRPEIKFSLADAVNLNLKYTNQSEDVFAEFHELFAPERNEFTASLTYSF